MHGERVAPSSNAKQTFQKHFGGESVPPHVKGLAGSAGGVFEALLLQPVDVIKTRMQLDTSGRYRGVYHCGASIFNEEGVRALWKGFSPFAIHLTLKYGLRLGTNSAYENFLRGSDGTLSKSGKFAAGFCAGVTEALIIVTPFEVVKVRLQSQRTINSTGAPKYSGTLITASTIVREEGLRALWSGAAPTVCRNGLNQASMFSSKAALDFVLWGKTDENRKTLLPWQSSISGFVAGIVGPCSTGPFDVVKTRLMAQSNCKVDGSVPYKGMVDALIRIPREEGFLSLWKGLLPRLLRIPPGQAIMWTVADQIIAAWEDSS